MRAPGPLIAGKLAPPGAFGADRCHTLLWFCPGLWVFQVCIDLPGRIYRSFVVFGLGLRFCSVSARFHASSSSSGLGVSGLRGRDWLIG
jgi:hypothetical protein